MSQDQERPFASSVMGSEASFVQKNKKSLLAASVGIAAFFVGYILSDVNLASAPKVSTQELLKHSEAAKIADESAPVAVAEQALDLLEFKAAESEQPDMPGGEHPSSQNAFSSPFGPSLKGEMVAAFNQSPGEEYSAVIPDVGPSDSDRDERIDSLEREVEALRTELVEIKKTHARQIQAHSKSGTKQRQFRIPSSESGHLPHLAALGAGAYISATPDKINLLSGGREIEIRAGQRFPNGSTYIGFDRSTQIVKTDRGDYIVN